MKPRLKFVLCLFCSLYCISVYVYFVGEPSHNVEVGCGRVFVKNTDQCGRQTWTRCQWCTCNQRTLPSNCAVMLMANQDRTPSGTKMAKICRRDRSARYEVRLSQTVERSSTSMSPSISFECDAI